MCQNGGVCEVDAMTNTTTCNCDAEFTGLICEYMIQEDTAGVDMSKEDGTGEDDTSGEYVTRDDTTDTTGQDRGPPETAAFGTSSAAFHTTNFGVIVALLILRLRLFGCFGF